MGLGLPDGGHLTHGYYVRTPDPNWPLRPKLTRVCTDREEENDRFVDLLPISPLRYHP